jgi:hypothetical protein
MANTERQSERDMENARDMVRISKNKHVFSKGYTLIGQENYLQLLR